MTVLRNQRRRERRDAAEDADAWFLNLCEFLQVLQALNGAARLHDADDTHLKVRDLRRERYACCRRGA